VSLAAFGVKRPVPANLLMSALIAGGIYSGATLTREFFPEITPELAQVTLPYPGATPEEIEESLARKVEDKLADLDEVDELRTSISEGGGGISVEFRDGVDVDDAVNEIERVVDSLTDLPDEAERIQSYKVEPSLPVIMVSLYGDADEAVRKRAIRRIRDDLLTLPGMGDITVSGIREYEVRVDVRADALLEHQLTLPQVAAAVRAWMTDVPGGAVRTNVGNVTVRAMGVAERAEEIRQIVVKGTADGQALRVGDIADVREDFVDEQIEVRFSSGEHGGPSSGLTVFRVGDQDAVEIAEMVRAYVDGRRGDPFEARVADRFNDSINALTRAGAGGPPPRRSPRRRAYDLGAGSPEPLPAGCRLAAHSDLARFIEGRLDLLVRNAKAGAVLVFATLLFFLNWRAAVWVGVGLTTALCGTLLMMQLFGITLNLLTMFGLIVVIGLLVDDAIVVAENIQARHDRGESSLVAAIKGTEEVFWPVVATVLTSIVAFMPLMLLKGQIGDMLGALPMVVSCALAMSLVESILILPGHMGHSLVHRDKARSDRPPSWIQRLEARRDGFIFHRIIPTYVRLLRLSLHYRYVSLCAALAVLMVAVGLVAGGRLEFTFLPDSDSETIVVDLRTPIGTALTETSSVVQRIERVAAAQSETRSVSALVGVRTNADDMSGVTAAGFGTHLGQVYVELLPVEQRDRESAQVIARIREQVGPLDGVESLKFSEIQGGPGGTDITIHVRGEAGSGMLEVVELLKRRLGEFEGIYDVADDNADGQREVQIRLKPGAAALGFTLADVAGQVRGALFGIDAHVFSAEQEDIDVRVRLEEDTRRSLWAIENIWLVSPTGDRVPLPEIAELTEESSYSTVRRIDRRRSITVTADAAPGTNPERIMPQLEPGFRRLEAEHPGVTIELGGRQRQFQRAFDSLPIGFAAALVLVYVILAWLFGSYTQPVAVMLAIPFGVVGVVLGHLLMGFQMTFLSLIGFVALSGIVVNDSLIFVQFYNDRRRAGANLLEGLVEAGRQRLRPIFLTTVTTVLGLTPLMLEQSFQAKFLIPMAISIAFGLMSATVLILLVLPCIIVIFDDIRAASFFLWHGLPREDGSAEEAFGDLGMD
jgi:multidrug efflux pump subunit AcrB